MYEYCAPPVHAARVHGRVHRRCTHAADPVTYLLVC